MILALSMTAAGATFRELPALPGLAEDAELVAVGVVSHAASQAAPWGLVTRYELDVEQVLHGPARSAVTFTLPGGTTAEGWTQRWSGIPVWAVGDEVVVVLPRGGGMPVCGVLGVQERSVFDPLGRWGERPVPLEELPARILAR